MRIAAWLTYNGAPFSGFARQNGQRTVQGSIEEALELLFHREVETTCAGRTDTGVHALCQVVSFDLLPDEWFRRKPDTLLRSLNALTHEAISFREVRPMPEDFSARFSAMSREYHYYLCTDDAPPLLMESFCWHVAKPLDIEAMRNAAHYLIGEHDFKSFCMAVSAKGKPTKRFVSEVSFTQEQIWNSNFIRIRVVGNAFLHSMVRTMVGTLALVGAGKRPPEWVKEVLEARNRQAAGQNAPAQGLVLWNVVYPEEDFYYDPRPSEHRGEVVTERSLSDAIEEIALFEADTEELPRVHEPSDKQSGKGGKRAKKAVKAAKGAKATKAVKSADKEAREVKASPWSKWWQEKEHAREMVIPRGPNLEGAMVDPVASASALPVNKATQATKPKAQSVVPSGAAHTEVPAKGKKAEEQPAAASKAPKASKSAKAKQPNSFAAELKQTLPGFDTEATQADGDSTEPLPTQSPTVLTAAGARARRRAREANQ
ncbi:tRNA pseudouridine(38-40) synthase TruA [Anaerotardibacter muris]|uniref:tRNA pseudouridine(38-40) synthase TruA n=1 Tax=Anaerotardibacter muris TaxID=2941505 RepID=UPI00203ACF71|nr:tRNA pseudouridine(38-40) synthase TruA [Anaerotardibacter muris]